MKEYLGGDSKTKHDRVWCDLGRQYRQPCVLGERILEAVQNRKMISDGRGGDMAVRRDNAGQNP